MKSPANIDKNDVFDVFFKMLEKKNEGWSSRNMGYSVESTEKISPISPIRRWRTMRIARHCDMWTVNRHDLIYDTKVPFFRESVLQNQRKNHLAFTNFHRKGGKTYVKNTFLSFRGDLTIKNDDWSAKEYWGVSVQKFHRMLWKPWPIYFDDLQLQYIDMVIFHTVTLPEGNLVIIQTLWSLCVGNVSFTL